jgi:hypothetical protein
LVNQHGISRLVANALFFLCSDNLPTHSDMRVHVLPYLLISEMYLLIATCAELTIPPYDTVLPYLEYDQPILNGQIFEEKSSNTFLEYAIYATYALEGLGKSGACVGVNEVGGWLPPGRGGGVPTVLLFGSRFWRENSKNKMDARKRHPFPLASIYPHACVIDLPKHHLLPSIFQKNAKIFFIF